MVNDKQLSESSHHRGLILAPVLADSGFEVRAKKFESIPGETDGGEPAKPGGTLTYTKKIMKSELKVLYH